VSDREEPGGGLTGATGDLTLDTTARPFVPAERREMENSQAEVTVSPARRSAQELSSEDGPLVAGDVTELAQADGGYGSERGMSGDDPAYRMEQRIVTESTESSAEGEEVRSGVDEITDRVERL